MWKDVRRDDSDSFGALSSDSDSAAGFNRIREVVFGCRVRLVGVRRVTDSRLFLAGRAGVLLGFVGRILGSGIAIGTDACDLRHLEGGA